MNQAEIREFYNNAPSVLKHALLTISPDEHQIIAASFAETVEEVIGDR